MTDVAGEGPGGRGHDADDPISLMATPAPSFTPAGAERIVRERYGIDASAGPLASERDQNFRMQAADGREFVLKIANPGESADVPDFQAQALAHVARVAPALPVPRIEPGRGGRLLQDVDVDGARYLVRLVSFLPGVPVEGVEPTAALRRSLASTLAGLGHALRGFFHPAARHPLLWDVRRAAMVAPLCRHIDDAARRKLARDNFERFASRTEPQLATLRAQVIHNDFNPDNVLVAADDPDTVAGIIDFGDMLHAPLINDLAVLAAYQVVDQDDPAAVAAEFAAAYHAVLPLEPAEVDILFELMIMRLTMSVAICAWRAKEHPENVAYILGNHERYWKTLERLRETDVDAASDTLRAACGMPARHTATHEGGREQALRERRRALLGPSLRLSYDEPLHIVRGEGAWLYDASGRTYLDAYNNVACVGHSHPAVAAAITRQAATLNTNTRYLHEHIVEYAARLGERLPGDLSVCYFVCTGSEANDLAWQIAQACTGGHGAIVTRHAYHGNTTAVAQLSPEELAEGLQQDWVAKVPAPDTYNGPHRGADAAERYAEHLDAAIALLESRGHRPAAFFADTIYTSDGIHIAPDGYLASAWERVRAAGGLCIADEVQAGLGRTGDHEWGFEQQRVVPDIVTLGKPMGNGHPLAAVVTTPAIAEVFARDRYYFNTFGGNPVSCAAGLAVLDVLDRERLRENARDVGGYLRERLSAIAERHASIGDVRGAGLFTGVELVRDRGDRTPDADLALRVMNAMRREGVLIGRTGLHGNVLKIRPPLVFSRDNAGQLATTLDAVLGSA